MADNPYEHPHWQLVDEVTDELLQRFGATVLAIGVHGRLAHCPADEISEPTEDTGVHLVVVTGGAGRPPRPATRRSTGSSSTWWRSTRRSTCGTPAP